MVAVCNGRLKYVFDFHCYKVDEYLYELLEDLQPTIHRVKLLMIRLVEELYNLDSTILHCPVIELLRYGAIRCKAK